MSDDNRLLPIDECERILRRYTELRKDLKLYDRQPELYSWWSGELRWARNQVNLTSDRRDVRFLGITNQYDDVSLKGVLSLDQNQREMVPSTQREIYKLTPPLLPEPVTTIWSDATYNTMVSERAQVAQVLATSAAEHGMLSAGYLEMRAGRVASIDAPADTLKIQDFTQVQCSMTVRHPKGVGSGWAGLSSFDWKSIDAGALAQRALDKCMASLNPVAIEPGRYTVVLDPQAVIDLVSWIPWSRSQAQTGQGPWPLEYDGMLRLWRLKLGLKVVDERITIEHDPTDPVLGVLSQKGLGSVTWIKNGVLTALNDARRTALEERNENLANLDRPAIRMSGGSSSQDELVASTERGLVVTRFSGIIQLDQNSVLLTGVTRDGLWLIERGKITKAVKNMRFTESPLFMLNQIEQMGKPVPVFYPNTNPYIQGVRGAVVPPVKTRDFSFTSTVDAV